MRISDWSSDVCSSDLAVENAGALDEIPELADVARPVVPHQQRKRGFVEAAFGVGGHVTLKMADERGDVLDAIGEAGNLEHDHAEADEQVFAEFAVGDRSAKILMPRRDAAHIDLAHQIGRQSCKERMCQLV